MASLFAVGLPFSYDGTTNHFATSTGGTATVAAVTSADTVTIDSASGNATLTVAAAWTSSTLTINNASATIAGDATHGINTTGTLTLTAGTLNTNGQTCSWGSLVANGSGVRTLTFGASAITVTTGIATVGVNTNVSTNLTVTANTATITMNFTNAQLNSGSSINYNGLSLVFTGGGASQGLVGAGSNTNLKNLTVTGTANKNSAFNFSQSNTFTNNVTFTGNSVTNRLHIFENSGIGSGGAVASGAVTITCNGAWSATNVDFRDLTFAGSAGTLTGTSLGDCLGNSGVTFNAPVTQTWNANATNNWSSLANWTSRVPLPQDNVVINGLTSGTITMDMPRMGTNIDLTGSTGGTITAGIATAFFGNLTWASNVSWGGGANSMTCSGRGAQTITSAGKTLGALTGICPGGSYTLQDNYSTTGSVNWQAGNFSTGDNNLNSLSFVLTNTNNTRVITFGTNNTITLSGTGNVWAGNANGVTFNANTSTIVLSDTSATAKSFLGVGLTYNNLQINGAVSAAAVTMTGSSTFNNITGQANAHLSLTSGSTTTISSLTSQGTAGNLFTLDAVTAGVKATLTSTNRIATDFLSVKDNTAAGNTPFYAGANGTLVSGDTNWSATAAPPIGGTLLLMGV